MEKLAVSFGEIFERWLRAEEKSGFTGEEIVAVFATIRQHICRGCERSLSCWEGETNNMYHIGYEVLLAIDGYGNDGNVEMQRMVAQNCIKAPCFLRECRQVFREMRKELMWHNRIIRERMGCAIPFEMICHTVPKLMRELEHSIFQDSRLEKKIRSGLRRLGVRTVHIHFLKTPDGYFEMRLWARALSGNCIPLQQIVKVLSRVSGRQLELIGQREAVLHRNYIEIVCRDRVRFYTMQGIATTGKGNQGVSGDTHTQLPLPGGRLGVALSDGMGTGEEARKKSIRVMELLESFLCAGFPAENTIQMINMALSTGQEEIFYATLDVGVLNLYTGKCRFLKAGAATTFLKRNRRVEKICLPGLPLGVLHRFQPEVKEKQLGDGDFIIMVTDGVLGTFPEGEQEETMAAFIRACDSVNPGEMARSILEKVLHTCRENPGDDMTVLVTGIWRQTDMRLAFS